MVTPSCVVLCCAADAGGLQEPQRHPGFLLPLLQQQPGSAQGQELGRLLLRLHEGRR